MNYLRYAILIGGALSLATGLGFAFQVPIVTAMWPWPDGRLSYLFIGSILAAVSVAMLWIGWTGELGALPAGSLNVLVIAATTTLYFFYLSTNSHPELMPYGLAGIVSVIASAAAFFWSQKIPLGDERPTPLLVRISFGIFIIALALAGGALVLRSPIFPWAVKPDSSVIFGCIFLGDAFYFLYGLLKPRWHNALGQLLSFLAYDLVLIVPFLMLFGAIKPEYMLSLIIYVAVLVYSGAVSIYFLFIDKQTRKWSASTSTGKAKA
ncbi:MAG: hypothetical protein WCF84_12765 [Anaerolineae bacterium]